MTHIHIIQYTPRMRRFSFAFTFFLSSYCITVSSSRHLDLCSILHSLFSRLFRSFALIIFVLFLALVLSLSFLIALALVTIVRFVLSLYLSTSSPRHYLLSGMG